MQDNMREYKISECTFWTNIFECTLIFFVDLNTIRYLIKKIFYGKKKHCLVLDLPANTKQPTVDIKPERNELNGNVPTKLQ